MSSIYFLCVLPVIEYVMCLPHVIVIEYVMCLPHVIVI